MSAVRDRQLHIQREYITSQSGKGEMLEDDDASWVEVALKSDKTQIYESVRHEWASLHEEIGEVKWSQRGL